MSTFKRRERREAKYISALYVFVRNEPVHSNDNRIVYGSEFHSGRM